MELRKNLNPKEQEILFEALEKLAEKNYIIFENRKGMDCIVLTKPGFDEIY